MNEAERRTRQALRDASDGDVVPIENVAWIDDMLVPLDSPLDKETLDERAAHGMGPSWEDVRRGADE